MSRILSRVVILFFAFSLILHAQQQNIKTGLHKVMRDDDGQIRIDGAPALKLLPATQFRFASRTSSLSDVQPFPYQASAAFSPLTATQFNPIALSASQVMVFWRSSDSLFSAASSDTGMTWGARQFVRILGPTTGLLRATRLNSGRILLSWIDSTGLNCSSSDNNGATFPLTTTLTTGTTYPYGISQTSDAKVWLSYYRSNGIDNDIFYRTSGDSAKTWSAEQTFTATSLNEVGAAFVDSSSTILGFYTATPSGGRTYLYRRASYNGGTSWSNPVQVFSDTLERFTPRLVKSPNGTVTLVCQVANVRLFSHFFGSTLYPGGFATSDIYTYKSLDSGTTWTQPTQFTRFAGADNQPLTCSVSNQVFISFFSGRYNAVQTWYGIAGKTSDLTPPSYVTSVSNGTPDPANPVLAMMEVFDENGVQDVKVTTSANGGPSSGPYQLYDDGSHQDYQAGDGTYAGTTAVFQAGDVVSFTYTIKSYSTATLLWYFTNKIPAVHNVGNVKLAINDNSFLGTSGGPASATWPKVGGQNYLFTGGLMIGGTVGGSSRVMKAHFSQADWTRTSGTPFTSASGISDQDITVTYDDSLATTTAPIGLRVLQKSYQWTASSRGDFVILSYRVQNRNLATSIDSIFVGLFLDPDVGTNPGFNAVGYDAARNLLYVMDSSRTGGMLGLRVLGAGNPIRSALFYAFYSDPTTDAGWMTNMKSGMNAPTTTLFDYRIMAVANPFPLAANQARVASFGIVLGSGLASLQAHADTMEALFEKYLPITGVASTTLQMPTSFSLSQNFLTRSTHRRRFDSQFPRKAGFV